jgi:hypothetical protein
MQQLEHPLVLLRQLKGAPLSCLFALAIEKKPVTQSWLVAMTGYDAKTVRNGLIVLTTFNYAIRIGGHSWQIASSFQLPIMTDEIDPKGEILPLSPTTTTNINASIMPVNVKAVGVVTKGEILPNCNPIVYELLKHAGVGEPVRSELARNENLSEEYVKLHIEKMRKERKPPAMLIHRLRNGDEIQQESDPEDHRRYLTGRFGDFANR